jgi:hypothetical protein
MLGNMDVLLISGLGWSYLCDVRTPLALQRNTLFSGQKYQFIGIPLPVHLTILVLRLRPALFFGSLTVAHPSVKLRYE